MIEEKDGYISRSKLMKDIFYATVAMGSTDLLEVIRTQPNANVIPAVRGRWVIDKLLPTRCSVCKELALFQRSGEYEFLSNFCPYCGAIMHIDGTTKNG